MAAIDEKMFEIVGNGPYVPMKNVRTTKNPKAQVKIQGADLEESTTSTRRPKIFYSHLLMIPCLKVL